MLRHTSIFLKVLKKVILKQNKKNNYLNITQNSIIVCLFSKFKINKFCFPNEAITLSNHNYLIITIKIFLNITGKPCNINSFDQKIDDYGGNGSNFIFKNIQMHCIIKKYI